MTDCLNDEPESWDYDPDDEIFDYDHAKTRADTDPGV